MTEPHRDPARLVAGILIPLVVATSVIIAAPVRAHELEPINTEFALPVHFVIWDSTISVVDEGHSRLYGMPGFGLEAPINDRAQFEVALPFLVRDSDMGADGASLGDLELGFRYRLAAADADGVMPDIGLNVELGMPTGDAAKQLGGEAWEVAIGAFASKAVGRSLLFANVSYAAEVPRDAEEPRENLIEFATAAVYSVNETLHPTVELFGEWNTSLEETEAFLAPELIVSVADDWEAKAAVPVGLTDTSSDIGVQLQLTHIFDHGHGNEHMH